MSSNAEKLYKLISNDTKKKQSLFMTALTNPKKALEKICDIGNELNISVTKEEVIETCRENLTNYKIPREVLFRDELPKSNVGKILRRLMK